MQFPPVDEPTIVAVNEVVRQCAIARRLFVTALGTDPDERMEPLLRRGAEAHAHIVAALHEDLFGAAGAASRDGDIEGLARCLKEWVGQRVGWRDERQLVETLVDQKHRTLDSIDAALESASGNRIAAILSAQRTVSRGCWHSSKPWLPTDDAGRTRQGGGIAVRMMQEKT